MQHSKIDLLNNKYSFSQLMKWFQHNHIPGLFQFSPKRNRNSVNSRNLINHWSMHWDQFKSSLCYLCPPGAEVECWFLTQKIASSNTPFLQIMFFKFCRFFRINLGKTFRIIWNNIDKVHLTNCANIMVYDTIAINRQALLTFPFAHKKLSE